MLDFVLDFTVHYQRFTGHPAVIQEQRDNSGGTATITAAEQREQRAWGMAARPLEKPVMSKSRAAAGQHPARSRSFHTLSRG
ncbi:hypothetical protein ABC974_10580 [Sphingomonas oligophenolica]|uniref:Uncharacterized protein n=1 Tax=Sphingomonas oligophenolica TaxID=301154 RepID=A0ABU9Y2P0_9SPHN